MSTTERRKHDWDESCEWLRATIESSHDENHVRGMNVNNRIHKMVSNYHLAREVKSSTTLKMFEWQSDSVPKRRKRRRKNRSCIHFYNINVYSCTRTHTRAHAHKDIIPEIKFYMSNVAGFTVFLNSVSDVTCNAVTKALSEHGIVWHLVSREITQSVNGTIRL